jgi:hypothetical protein
MSKLPLVVRRAIRDDLEPLIAQFDALTEKAGASRSSLPSALTLPPSAVRHGPQYSLRSRLPSHRPRAARGHDGMRARQAWLARTSSRSCAGSSARSLGRTTCCARAFLRLSSRQVPIIAHVCHADGHVKRVVRFEIVNEYPVRHCIHSGTIAHTKTLCTGQSST